MLDMYSAHGRVTAYSRRCAVSATWTLQARLIGVLVVALLAFILPACSAGNGALDEQGARDLAWRALEPNTSSHNRSAWQVVSLRTVGGADVREMFAGTPVPGGCAPGPTPPENSPIVAARRYYLVEMRPRPATALPEQLSPTAPPNVPEPFVYQADFLIDVASGQIVARKLRCVIY